MIYIFSGPVGSGKTTILEKWIKGRSDVSGILMPVLDGIRHIYSISSKKLFPIEADKNDVPEKAVNTGKYFFSRDLFDWGNNELTGSANIGADILIVDEVGPLELTGEGFSPALKQILTNKRKLSEKTIILVIREGMIEPVMDHFNISEYVILRSLTELKKKLIF